MKNTTVLKTLGWAIVIVFLFWLVTTFPKGNTVIQQIVGANAGPIVYDHQYFLAGVTSGGLVATSTTVATYGAVAKDFRQLPTVWVITPNAETTITLPAAAFYELVPTVGDEAVVYIKDASAADDIIFDAGTGLTLLKSEDDEGVTIGEGLWNRLTVTRSGASAVVALLENFVAH